MEEFMECNTVDGFKNLHSAEKEFQAVGLWARSQSFWIHPKIFEILEANRPQRAGRLAINTMSALNYGDLDLVPPKQVHNLIIFLCAIENFHATKVSLSDAPTSELFDKRAAQEIMGCLDPERGPGHEESAGHRPFPDKDARKEKRKRNQKTGKAGTQTRGGRIPNAELTKKRKVQAKRKIPLK
jgi:hypothetical protein